MTTFARIALVVPDLRFGGGQRVMLELSRRFVDAGVRVDLVNLAGDGELAAEIPEGVRHYCAASRKNGLRLALASIAWLHRYFRSEKPDAVLVTMTGANIATLLAGKAAGFSGKLVVREAASTMNTSIVRRILMRLAYGWATTIVTVSRGVGDDLAAVGLPRNRLLAIPNPIDVLRVRRLADEPQPRPMRPYIVALGRLTVQKDHATLLEAYAVSAVRATHSLVIIGEGPERQALESRMETLGLVGEARLAGALANPYPLVKGASLMVLSSRWEGYPNVLLEALAVGTPVVSTDCPAGPSELLGGGRYGRLVPVGDAVALAQAMADELAAPSPDTDHVLDQHRPSVVAARYADALGIAGMEPS